MSLKLFTKSYVNDFGWLKLAIKSVIKLCKEPVEWAIVVEDGESKTFKPFLEQAIQECGNKPIVIGVTEVSQAFPEAKAIQSGYLRQQWVKMNAHKVMGGDLFWNWDSDVIAIRPFDSNTFKNAHGKPIYWFSQINHLMAGGADQAAHEGRRHLTEICLDYHHVCFEFMRCMPVPLVGSILAHVSDKAEWEKAYKILVSGDQRFSEFNVMGQYFHLYFPEVFDWRNAENNAPTWSGGYVEGGVGSGAFQEHAIIAQCWSWGGIPAHITEFVNGL